MDPPAAKRRRRVQSQLQSLPQDAIREILLRCSVETIQRICSVWPRCLSTVREKNFLERYHERKRREEEIILFGSEAPNGCSNFVSTIVGQQETSLLFSSSQLRRDMEYACGILCSGTTIFDPTIGISRSLPPFPVDQSLVPAETLVKTYIGFDQSSSRFKILGLSKKSGSNVWGNHHIFTLEQERRGVSWRPLICNIPHEIFLSGINPKSISIGGFLYYSAFLPNKRCSMMHLNLRSETFGSNVVPHVSVSGQYVFHQGLFEVNGKPGVCFLQMDGSFIVWILEDLKMNIWSSVIVKTPDIILDQLTQFSSLRFEGFTRIGDYVFSEANEPFFYLYFYNARTRVVQRTLFPESSAYPLRRHCFRNHVGSLLFI